MPEQKIQTTKYECNRCEYRWIGRKNGKETDTLPSFCPRCKTDLWNVPYKHDMWRSKREGLMMRALSGEKKEGESMDEFAKRVGTFESKWDKQQQQCSR